MKFSGRSLATLAMVSILSILIGCGGGGGSGSSGGSSTGTVSMSITDAKPVLPDNVTNCFVTIDAVSVHSSEGGWETLEMVRTPYTIDLLQFTDGVSAEFVPPARLRSGKYTQVRLSVLSASLRFNDDPAEEVDLTIPSANLKTDKNFTFDVTEKAAVDITIDFDLSKSIVVEGPAANPSYKLKPVLHIVETAEAATVEGFITSSEIDGDYAIISVLDSNDEEYTKVQVPKASASDSPYSIYWLVPNQAYRIRINYNPELDDDQVTPGIQDNYDEVVDVPSDSDPDYPDGILTPGAIYPLDFPLTN
jgi:hypothetical protein